ncbi:MAG: hypothetical protein M3Y49_14545 [Actinomycetota bacterium]|nr:hypothetical protein [Actinomycetota bacterium]
MQRVVLPDAWSALHMHLAARLFVDLADLVVPATCGGCAAPGSTMCRTCTHSLRRGALAPGSRVDPQPAPVGFPSTWAQGEYAGVLSSTLRRYKDADRADLCGWCSVFLRSALATCLSQDDRVRGAVASGDLRITSVPSSARAMRARGRDPLWEVLLRATDATRPVLPQPARLLRISKRTQDQVGLSAHERARNVHRSMLVPTAARQLIDGRVVIIVDDIVTTGSTLVEASRALTDSGASYVVAVCIAATRRDRYRQGMEHTASPRETDVLPARVVGRR